MSSPTSWLCLQFERQLQSTQQQMKDAEDEYEKAEKRLQEQLRETKEQLNMAQRVFSTELSLYSSVFVCSTMLW